MASKRTIQLIGILIETLQECGNSAPESFCMLGLKLNLEEWNAIRDLCLRLEWIRVSHNRVELTSKGIELLSDETLV